MQGWSVLEAKQRCEVTEIKPFLEQGQLAGYARAGGPHNDLVAIPQSAWADMDIVDENGSCLIHHPTEIELSDLRIYPILHAPDAPELLHDRGLGEVFMTSIVQDPEVAALGRRVLVLEDYRKVFRDGYAPGPTLDSYWHLDWDAEKMALQFVCPIMWFLDAPLPQPSAAVVAAATALADRIVALRALLSTGRVVAMGTHRNSGHVDSIHRAQWSRTNQSIDIANGDLCEPDAWKWIAIWTGIILECPDAVPKTSAGLRFEQMIDGFKTPKMSVSSIAAETRCASWLKQLVFEQPAGRVKPRGELLKEAKQKWPRLSGRGFDRAWYFATSDDVAAAWRTGGRPRKTPAPKTSAPK